MCAAARRATGRCSSSVRTFSAVPLTRLALAAGAPPLPPCRPAPCHRPEFSPFCCRPSFSPPVHPRRRRYTRVADRPPCQRPVLLLRPHLLRPHLLCRSADPPRASGRCISSSARTSSAPPDGPFSAKMPGREMPICRAAPRSCHSADNLAEIADWYDLCLFYGVAGQGAGGKNENKQLK